MKSIIIIIDYFGLWPDWFFVFLESCRKNPTITWLFHTDCPIDSYNIENVKFHYISKSDYVSFICDKLKVRFCPGDNYKLCDLKPMYGILYEDEIEEYDFYGYGDIDVIYGDIRKFYTDKVLENNVISTHTWCVSGHLALFKNEKWLRNSFCRVKGWKAMIENPFVQRFDEDNYSRLFRYPNFIPQNFYATYNILKASSAKYRTKLYFVEQFTTPLTPIRWRDGTYSHPEAWFWRNGQLTNDKDGELEYIYLHFMNYKNGRFMNPVYGQTAFWSGLPNVVNVKQKEITNGVKIDRYGIHTL